MLAIKIKFNGWAGSNSKKEFTINDKVDLGNNFNTIRSLQLCLRQQLKSSTTTVHLVK